MGVDPTDFRVLPVRSGWIAQQWVTLKPGEDESWVMAWISLNVDGYWHDPAAYSRGYETSERIFATQHEAQLAVWRAMKICGGYGSRISLKDRAIGISASKKLNKWVSDALSKAADIVEGKRDD